MISQAGPYLCITVLGHLVLNRKEINLAKLTAYSSINKNGSEKKMERTLETKKLL